MRSHMHIQSSLFYNRPNHHTVTKFKQVCGCKCRSAIHVLIPTKIDINYYSCFAFARLILEMWLRWVRACLGAYLRACVFVFILEWLASCLRVHWGIIQMNPSYVTRTVLQLNKIIFQIKRQLIFQAGPVEL